jgi:hypothetical protein
MDIDNINHLDLMMNINVDMLDVNSLLMSDDKFEDIVTTDFEINTNQTIVNTNQTIANTNQTIVNTNQTKFTKNDFSKITELDTESTNRLSNGLLSIYLTENNICGLITYEWNLYHTKIPKENSLKFVLGE